MASRLAKNIPSRSDLEDWRDRGYETARSLGRKLPDRSELADLRDRIDSMASDLADRLPSRSKLAGWRDSGFDTASDLADRLPTRSDIADWTDRGVATVKDAASSLRSIEPPAAVDVARGLGWFSIVLGAMELLGGRGMAERAGLSRHTGLLRFYGLREIATGLAILAKPSSPNRMWVRVAGDAMDAATLATGLRRDNPKKAMMQMALASVLLITALDVLCARQLEEDR